MIDIGECFGHCQGQMNFAIEPGPGDMIGCTGSHYRKVEMFKRKRIQSLIFVSLSQSIIVRLIKSDTRDMRPRIIISEKYHPFKRSKHLVVDNFLVAGCTCKKFSTC